MSGILKPIGTLDRGELIVLARKYAIVLQTEFGQITIQKRWTDAEAGIKLMQSHSPIALTGLCYLGHRSLPKGFVDLKDAEFTKYPSTTAHRRPRVIHTIVGPKDISKPDRAKRGHGPRKKKSL